MNKEELLSELTSLSQQGLVSKEEILAAVGERPSVNTATEFSPETESAATSSLRDDTNKHVSISDILYYIGGGIVFLGVAVMVYGSWDDLSKINRILVTLGIGVISYLVGAFLNYSKKFENMATAFFFISALVLPVGMFVTFANMDVKVYTPLSNVIISAILFIVFLSSFFNFKRIIFLIFSIIYGTWLFYALTEMIASGRADFSANFYIYRTLLVGVSLMFLGYYFSQKENLKEMRGWLYNFGALLFLGAGIALSGFWQVIYPGFVFGIIFLSIQTKSKAFLVWGSIFLMSYILKITALYFSQGLGWPIALMFAGLCLIGIGYYAFYLNKKYFTKD